MKTLDAYDAMLDDMTKACALQEVPTGAVAAEYAAGQFEINLEHVDDPIQAADDCVLFKRIVQGVAQKHGFQATFMAKPYLNRAGNGMHMHVSLLDGLSRHVFDGCAAIAIDTLPHAIGGALEVLPESRAFLAPNRSEAS